MKSKDYEIAKELKEKLSKVVRLVDFRVFCPENLDKHRHHIVCSLYIQ